MTVTPTDLSVVILAGGQGKRMGNPNLAKVMALLAGKPLIDHVLSTVSQLEVGRTIVIVGHHREQVIDYVSIHFAGVQFAIQHEQLGTGHAVQQTQKTLGASGGHILILSGDVPLLTANTLRDFIHHHRQNQSSCSVLSAATQTPTGYGRIVRDSSQNFIGIVEEKDASESQRAIQEINTGIYCVDADLLFSSLDQIKSNNSQGEFYLTDIIGILSAADSKVMAFCGEDFDEFMGINTVAELEQAEIVIARGKSISTS